MSLINSSINERMTGARHLVPLTPEPQGTPDPVKLTASSPIANVCPAPNVLFVRVLDQAGISSGGIILPQRQADAPCQGQIVYMGEVNYTPATIKFMPKVGDRISMKRFGFSEIAVNGEQLRQIGISDVLAILKSTQSIDKMEESGRLLDSLCEKLQCTDDQLLERISRLISDMVKTEISLVALQVSPAPAGGHPKSESPPPQPA